MNALAVTGPSDLRDQRWLDERVASIDDGIEAVLDIARNWTDGRNLARLHQGSAQDYILSHVQHPLGRGVVVPLLVSSNWSNRQIAAVAGTSPDTVNRAAKQLTEIAQLPDRPTRTLGADGKLRSVTPPRLRSASADPSDLEVANARHDLRELLDWMTRLAVPHSEDWYAASIETRRRAGTAKQLRKLGTWLGGIAWRLEGLVDPAEVVEVEE